LDHRAGGVGEHAVGQRERRGGPTGFERGKPAAPLGHSINAGSRAGMVEGRDGELPRFASTYPTRSKAILNEDRRLYPTTAGPQRALVVAVDLGDPQRPLVPELAEFTALAKAAGAVVVGEVVQKLSHVDPATLVGSGKAREIAERAEELNADVLMVFNDLRPRQRTNLEKVIPLPIVDRTMLILDIFAQHARSREGQLQVELAQLRYRQSNLIGAGAALSRLGGGVGTRGPGETKLETDRRRIAQRVSLLQRQLDDVRKQRETRRAGRGRDPFVALVGYTNVGKSSLLNRLAGSGQGEGAFVADQPFATLDPTLRRAYVAADLNVRLADTVGFITALPQELVNAFRATLEELDAADLLLHVSDASNHDWPRQKASVETILRELKLDEKPSISVFNKIDRLDPAARAALPPDAIEVSASSGEGIDALREAIAQRVRATA
jgi:GTP-binding protein HflX